MDMSVNTNTTNVANCASLFRKTVNGKRVWELVVHSVDRSTWQRYKTGSKREMAAAAKRMNLTPWNY